MVSKNKTVVFIPHEVGDHIPSLFNLHMSHHGPEERPFTSIPLKQIHLHIPHYWILIGPFLELTPLGLVLVLAVSPSHCSDGLITSDFPVQLIHSFLPNHFSNHINQNGSPWRRRQYVPPKHGETHLLHVLTPCSGIRGTYKREQTNLFIDKCRSKQNLL